MLNKYVLSDNGTLSDKTVALEDYYNGTVALSLVAAEDKLYIGSKLPFTRKYFKVSTANVVASDLSAKYWDGSQWRSVVDLYDGTASAGNTLAASGYLTWETDKRYAWRMDDTTQNGSAKIAELSTLTLYNYYWLQITFSGNASATLAWSGDLFATDNDLGAEYPDLNRTAVKTAFEAGKTTWEDQRRVASRIVSNDLKRIGSANSSQLVLPWDQLTLATVSKTAELIYAAMGQGYEASMKLAQEEYAKRMNRTFFIVDENQTGA
jgi:hypothetical protein